MKCVLFKMQRDCKVAPPLGICKAVYERYVSRIIGVQFFMEREKSLVGMKVAFQMNLNEFLSYQSKLNPVF